MRLVRILLLATALFISLTVVLGYVLAVIIVDNKAIIEQTLAEKMATRVQIGNIKIHWGWVGPVFELTAIKIGTDQSFKNDIFSIKNIGLKRVDLGVDLFKSIVHMDLDVAGLSLIGLEINGVMPQRVFDHFADHAISSLGGDLSGPSQLPLFKNIPGRLTIDKAIVNFQNERGEVLTRQVVNFEVRRHFGTAVVRGDVCPQNHAVHECLISVQGDMSLDAAYRGEGTFSLEGRNLPIIIPPLYAGQIKAQYVAAQVSFQRSATTFAVRVTDLQYVDQHAEVKGHIAVVHNQITNKTNLDLDLAVGRADADNITKYIPANVLPVIPEDWLKTSLKSGTIEEGVVKIKGDLDDIPSHDGDKNIFVIAMRLKHGVLQFHPAWPQIEDLFAFVEIGPNSLAIDVEKGGSSGITIEKSRIILPRFTDPARRLKLALLLETDGTSSYQFLKKSPLANTLGVFLQKVDIPRANIALHLTVPLASDAKVPLKGFVAFKHIGIKYKGTALAVESAEGKIDFTDDSFTGRGIEAQIMGMPISIDVGAASWRRHKPIIAKIDGKLSSRALAAAGFIDLSPYGEGDTAVAATVVVTSEKKGVTTDFDIKSNLDGMVIDLPHLYSKTREQVDPLHIHAVVDPDARLTMQATILRKWKGQFVSGPGFDFQRGFAGYLYKSPFPREIKMIPGNFIIQTPVIKGRIARQPGTEGKLLFDFDKVEITTKGDSTAASAPDNSRTKFMVFSDVVVTISNLHYNDIHIENFTAVVSSSEQGLNVKTLGFTLSGTQIKIDSAGWKNTEQGSETMLTGRLVTNNLGDLLKSQDVFAGVKGLQGQVNFSLQWPAKPWLFDRKNIAGDIDLELKGGTLKNANSMIYRIVDVITLQLQQTLKNDLEIKEVKGTLRLANGIVSTDAFSIELAGAKTDTKGSINLVDETIDSKIMLTVDLSRLVKIGIAFTINPVLGGLYWWKGNPESIKALDALTRHGYEITGRWQDPRVKMLPIIKLP